MSTDPIFVVENCLNYTRRSCFEQNESNVEDEDEDEGEEDDMCSNDDASMINQDR